jgi:hypothetical protein
MKQDLEDIITNGIKETKRTVKLYAYGGLAIFGLVIVALGVGIVKLIMV